MENKSKLLIVSTAINIIIGIEVIVVCLMLLPGLLSVFDDNAVAISAIFAFMPQFGALIALLVMSAEFVLVVIEIITAWISFKTNKKSWTIAHIIILINVSFIGLFFNAVYMPSTVFMYFSVFAVVLRIVAYFDEKKINS